MEANRIFPVEITGLNHGGAIIDADPFEILFDGTLLEIVASVTCPGTLATQAVPLQDLVEVFMELTGSRKGGTLPLTDNEFVQTSAIGGSPQIPGKDVRIEVSRGAKLRVSAKNIATVGNFDGLRLKLAFRAFDKAFPTGEASK